jgi:hypothetical protein
MIFKFLILICFVMQVSFIEIRQVFNDVRQVCANKETFVKHALFFSYEAKVQIRWPLTI